MKPKKTLVIGASDKPERYSYKAIQMLRKYNMEVEAIGSRLGQVSDVHFSKELLPFEDIDTITLYLNEVHQKEYYYYILSLHPNRIIFNPGAENNELKKLAEANNIICIEACTLVLLSTGQY